MQGMVDAYHLGVVVRGHALWCGLVQRPFEEHLEVIVIGSEVVETLGRAKMRLREESQGMES